MEDIKDYRHSFLIAGMEVELLINCKNDVWKCEIIKGETGTGTCSGGNSTTLQEYINKMEQEHRYSYNFFNYGYKAAKASIS